MELTTALLVTLFVFVFDNGWKIEKLKKQVESTSEGPISRVAKEIEALEGMISRRMENTGETREAAVANVLAYIKATRTL